MPSAALADYVFPASSTVEQPELWLSAGFCMACPQGIEPLYQRRNSYDLYRGLGLRLGQAEHWPWENVEEVHDHCLEPVGFTFRQLVDLQHSWWFPERDPNLPELFGAFESNANVLCPDDPEFCSPEIGSWPHSALLCRIEKEDSGNGS